jgi:hypothetical protein
MRRVLDDPEYREAMVSRNYEIGLAYFSYRRVATAMEALLSAPNLVRHGLRPERCFTCT